jgi:hypothetical protein
MLLPDEIEDARHEGAVAGAHLVDDEVLVRIVSQFIIGNEAARDGAAVPRLAGDGWGVDDQRGRRTGEEASRGP